MSNSVHLGPFPISGAAFRGLALLRHGRLIDPRRNGKNNIYSLTDTGRALVAAVKGFVGG
jgi:hypothetical protein